MYTAGGGRSMGRFESTLSSFVRAGMGAGVGAVADMVKCFREEDLLAIVRLI